MTFWCFAASSLQYVLTSDSRYLEKAPSTIHFAGLIATEFYKFDVQSIIQKLTSLACALEQNFVFTPELAWPENSSNTRHAHPPFRRPRFEWRAQLQHRPAAVVPSVKPLR